MTLLKRILAEKRAFVLPLGLALLVNVAVYALVVYPLEAKSAGAAGRADAAARALKAAEQRAGRRAGARREQGARPTRSWRRSIRRSCPPISPPRAA